jgi:hypothetical protein
MRFRRRDVLRAGATATIVGLAGCGANFTERPQLLVVRNETDTERTVTVTILEAAGDATATSPQTSGGTTASTTGTTASTSGTTRVPLTETGRWVVDFERTVAASGRDELVEVLPHSGEYEVVADVHDGPTATGSYVDEESVRIVIQPDDVTVESYLAEG